jgi:ParB family transcriptional regulator, chromosome partitioning protein
MNDKKIRVRGLRALIPVKPRTKPKRKKENVYYVEIKKIRQTGDQIKKEIDKKVLKELTESIKKFGVIQPLTVSKVEKRKRGGINVYYELVSGQKRLLAAKQAGLRVVPAVIKEYDKI